MSVWLLGIFKTTLIKSVTSIHDKVIFFNLATGKFGEKLRAFSKIRFNYEVNFCLSSFF